MADILSRAVALDTLCNSAELLNGFPSETKIPSQKNAHVDAIGALIWKFRLENLFAIAYLHRHQEVPKGKALVGTLVDERVWITPHTISDIKLDRIQPHILSVVVQTSPNGSQKIRILPSEFFDGPRHEHPDIDPEFFRAFVDYIFGNDLTNIIGLAVKQFDLGPMVEFSFPTGNLLVKKKEVKPNDNNLWLVTRWPVRAGAVVPEDGVVCAIVIEDNGQRTHVEITTEANTPSEALRHLKQKGSILESRDTSMSF